MTRLALILGIPAAVVVAACATGTNPAFLDADAAYQAAAADPEVTTNAPVELRDARQALDRAEEAKDGGASDRTIEHLSYLAKRRTELARIRAEKRIAEAQAGALVDQKDRVVLDARDRELDALKQELAELRARETERGLELTVGDVLFGVGQASLKPGALASLGRLADFLRAHPDRQVLVEGHTDSSGTPDRNLSLSLARADSVARALVAGGVDGTRISPRGFGEASPVASNDTAAGRLQNRRVEIVVVPSPEPTANPRVGAVR